MAEEKNITPENKPEETNVKSVDNWEQKLKENEKTAYEIEPGDSFKEEFLSSQTINTIHPSTGSNSGTGKEKAGFWFFLLLLAFCISAACGVYLSVHPGAMCTQKSSSGKIFASSSPKSKSTKEGIAWIKVRGVISESEDSSPFNMPTGASYISKRIREAAKDERIKAIVLDINSPGGTVASVQEIYNELLKAKEEGKKIVALFRDVAASGGFYIAMAADKIVAEPGTITGSVGVIMQTGNVVGLFDKLGIKVNPVTSGKYKDIGSAYREMTPAERALLQDMVDDTYSQFFEAVKTGRPGVKPADLTEYTDGRVFTGQRAFKLGFVDQLGGEETARLLAGGLAGLEDPKVIIKKGDNFREMLMSFGSNMENKTLSKQLQSMNTPSVSYLWVF